MLKIAVFASGNGSNFQALLEAIATGDLHAEIALLVCDRKEAKVVERAKDADVPTFVFSPKDYSNKIAFEQEIVTTLKRAGVNFIALAGYMRLVGPTLLQAFKGKIVNIHPSLLPAFPGKDAIGQAIDAKVKVTGVTVHYVDEGMDTGPIIAQESVNVNESESEDEIIKKIQQIEHRLYPLAISQCMIKK